MKKFFLLFFLLLFGSLEATDYLVTRSTDSLDEEGEIRVILHHACDHPGDDLIQFAPTRLPEIRIVLETPLVIPEDCQGRVTMLGSDEVDTLLDASLLSGGGSVPGDACTLHVYAPTNIIRNFSFVRNNDGAGTCLFGRGNRLDLNRFGQGISGVAEPNRFGVVVSNAFAKEFSEMDGAQNQIVSNLISHNDLNGVWVNASSVQIESNTISSSGENGIVLYGSAHQVSGNQLLENASDGILARAVGSRITDNTISGSGLNGIELYRDDYEVTNNQILENDRHGVRAEGDRLLFDTNTVLENAGHGIWIRSEGSTLTSNRIESNGRFGILIANDSLNLTIGGPSFQEDGNRIYFNLGGGVVIVGDETSEQHTITHNSIANNLGTGPNLDLGNNGVTENDSEDQDEGPNHLLNYAHHFQSFPLVPSLAGEDRYWGWGIDRFGDRVELYAVASEDIERDQTHGGGFLFLTDATVSGWTFDVAPGPMNTGQWTNLLTFDSNGNTSEYSFNHPVERDLDLDGLIDRFEPGDGTPESGGTDLESADSDLDSLPDPIEDWNRNGRFEPERGETAAFDPDTDHDLLGDFPEVHGDGVYDRNIDTDPHNPDTDGDGLLDGEEDRNGNGIWDAHLGESSPLWVDSDADGFNDPVDSCPHLFNPGQEDWYCQ